MRRQKNPASSLEDRQVPVQTQLAASWASFMFLYVYVDIFGLYMPGTINDILAGTVWELEITQTWAVGALTLMAFPILMVVLSITLRPRANRVTNLVVASVYVLVSAANAVGESWTYYFTLAVGLELFVLALILRRAWTWPRTARAASTDDAVVRMQQA